MEVDGEVGNLLNCKPVGSRETDLKGVHTQGLKVKGIMRTKKCVKPSRCWKENSHFQGFQV